MKAWLCKDRSKARKVTDGEYDRIPGRRHHSERAPL